MVYYKRSIVHKVCSQLQSWGHDNRTGMKRQCGDVSNGIPRSERIVWGAVTSSALLGQRHPRVVYLYLGEAHPSLASPENEDEGARGAHALMLL